MTTPPCAEAERPRNSRAGSAWSSPTSRATATPPTASLPTSLEHRRRANIVTLTAGGNDLLGGELPRAILRRLDQIARRIKPLGARVIVNTIYDPSDDDNDVGRRELGLSRLATIELRRRLNAVNRGIKQLADEHGFLLADLERLFHGHGVASSEPWFVQVIEPNLAGATATAEYWYELLNVAIELPGGRTAV
jgi:lysophospholipase L1-like esterase